MNTHEWSDFNEKLVQPVFPEFENYLKEEELLHTLDYKDENVKEHDVVFNQNYGGLAKVWDDREDVIHTTNVARTVDIMKKMGRNKSYTYVFCDLDLSDLNSAGDYELYLERLKDSLQSSLGDVPLPEAGRNLGTYLHKAYLNTFRPHVFFVTGLNEDFIDVFEHQRQSLESMGAKMYVITDDLGVVDSWNDVLKRDYSKMVSIYRMRDILGKTA